MRQFVSRQLAVLFAVAIFSIDALAIAENPDLTQPSTAPSTQPSAPAGSIAIPEIPTLSGTLFDRFAYTVHGQATSITQGHGDFPAKYSGPNSQTNSHDTETSWTGTLFTGIGLLDGTEVYVNPEVPAGSGIGRVHGIGDFPNGEITRVTSPDPSVTVARLFLRQTFGFGGPKEDIADSQNHVAGKQDVNRLTLTVGKFSASDIFDTNAYANDPRTQFLNLGLISNTSWDYPADTRGYTDGLTLELNGENSTLRYGIFREPQVSNGTKLDDHWDRAFGQVMEYEQRFTLDGHPGAIRPMGFINFAHMGSYHQAIEQMPVDPDVTTTRTYSQPKYGFGINAEQEITSDLGIFARLGWSNGQSEQWTFTEVDRDASLGLSLKGTRWSRPDDIFGFGGVIAGLAKDHRDYLAAGGLGGFLGDGKLNYAPEQILEVYYLIGVTKNIFLTADYQFVNHPGFNVDRGPISIGAFRLHFEF